MSTKTFDHPHRRMADNDRTIRVGDAIEKWFRLAWPLIVVIAGWYANHIRKPLEQIPDMGRAIQAMQVQQERAARIDSVSIEERRELRQGMMIMIRMLCNKQTDRDVRCDDIPIPTTPAFGPGGSRK